MKYEIHEAANIFPPDEGSLKSLAADIKKNGQHEPIDLYRGTVLDGRRRLRACEIAGVEPKVRDVETLETFRNNPDPVSYVLSMNLHRRHLTESQLSLVAGRAGELWDKYRKEAKKKQRDAAVRGNKNRHEKPPVQASVPELAKLPAPQTRKKVGEAFGIGERIVTSGARVLKDGVPEVIKAVDEGTMSATYAEILVAHPPEVQREEVSKPVEQRKKKYELQNGSRRSGHDPQHNPEDRVSLGKGIRLADEAINCLMRIPKNDLLRQRGLQKVMDWIKRNK